MSDRDIVLNNLVQFLESDTDAPVENLDESLSLREGLGLDSVDLVGIIMRIEEHYRIRLSQDELERITTVGTLIDLIHNKVADGSSQANRQTCAA
jgi:acyl carrier protein